MNVTDNSLFLLKIETSSQFSNKTDALYQQYN